MYPFKIYHIDKCTGSEVNHYYQTPLCLLVTRNNNGAISLALVMWFLYPLGESTDHAISLCNNFFNIIHKLFHKKVSSKLDYCSSLTQQLLLTQTF